MIWAMGALVVILLLLIATGNLRLMIGFLACVVVVITLLLVFDVFEDQRSASRIPVAQVELLDFKIDSGRAVHELSGRIQNHSADFGLFRLQLKVSALDCETETSALNDCTVIGEQIERMSVDVPAGQARDVQQRITMRDTPLLPRGVLRWKFEVVATGGG